MKLEFTRLVLRDFKEYRGKHVLDFSSLGFGVHYIRGRNRVDALGSNGAGKSTLWDAFVWALTGRTVRGLRGTDVRSWGGSEDAMSRVDFYCGDEPHWVKRSTEKNGLWLDGKLASQEEIDRTLGLSLVNIPHTIVLGQKRDLFFDLKPEVKLRVLSETLTLDKWNDRSQRAREKAKVIETEHDTKLFNIGQFELLIETARALLDRAKQQARDWELERAAADSKKSDQREELVQALAKATAEQGPLDLAYDGAETELRALRKDLLKKQAMMDEIIEKLQTARLKRDTRKSEYELLKELAESAACPTCGQEIEKHKAHAKEAKEKLKAAKKAWQIASDRVIVRETQKELCRDTIVRMRKSEGDFADKSDKAKDGLDHLTSRISDIKQRIAVLKAETREEEVNPFSALVAEIRSQIKRHKQSIADDQAIVDKLARKLVRTKYWVDGFKQVRLYLLQETLEELQEITQNILPDWGLSGWTVQYDIERETKSGSISTGLAVKILKPGMKKAVRWEAWSGGEGQRLLIVGALALSEVLLRRAGIECDLLVLDEPTRHMSTEGVADVVDFIVARSRDSQIFYCDHAAVESNRFASVITIEKDEHGSQIKIKA